MQAAKNGGGLSNREQISFLLFLDPPLPPTHPTGPTEEGPTGGLNFFNPLSIATAATTKNSPNFLRFVQLIVNCSLLASLFPLKFHSNLPKNRLANSSPLRRHFQVSDNNTEVSSPSPFAAVYSIEASCLLYSSSSSSCVCLRNGGEGRTKSKTIKARL